MSGGEAGRPGEQASACTISPRIRHQGDGRGRHRHAGALARRAVDAEASRRQRRRRSTQRVNDRLHAVVQRNPTALPAFAALPTADPGSRRRRTRTHRHKARLQGRDDARPRQRRLSRRQEVLADLRARRDARRADLSASVDAARRRDATIYYQDYVKDFPMVARRPGATRWRPRPRRSAWCCPACSRSIPSSRSSSAISARRCRSWSGASIRRCRGRGNKSMSFRDIFCNNFYITTSGNFSNPALLCCVQEMGVDRILFAVDWPFVTNPPGDRLDGRHAALRRRQGEDSQRQRQAAAADVMLFDPLRFTSWAGSENPTKRFAPSLSPCGRGC